MSSQLKKPLVLADLISSSKSESADLAHRVVSVALTNVSGILVTGCSYPITSENHSGNEVIFQFKNPIKGQIIL